GLLRVRQRLVVKGRACERRHGVNRALDHLQLALRIGGAKSFFCKAPSATEFNFGRNEKQNMAENPFVRSERRERKSYYRTPWIFRQILLVVKPKIKFWFIGVFPAFLYKKRKI
ncbi:MAG: hypothetical protein II631_03735, partial [Treponema sp.]|nr:hypothetical protein [Treponema sp.]